LLAVDRYQTQKDALHEFSAASQIESREATEKWKQDKKRWQMLESELKIAMEENGALSTALAQLAARVALSSGRTRTCSSIFMLGCLVAVPRSLSALAQFASNQLIFHFSC